MIGIYHKDYNWLWHQSTFDNYIDLFSKYGVTEIDALGKEFDPAFHNAVMQVEDPENAGKVVEVIRKGYIRNGKVIRYAMVKVAN